MFIQKAVSKPCSRPFPLLLIRSPSRGKGIRTDTAANKGEHEGGISGDLGRDLELEEAGS